MSRKFIKIVCLLVSTLMLLGIFVGCTKKTETKEQNEQNQTKEEIKTKAPKTIEIVNFFSSTGAYKTLLESEIDKFNNTMGREKGIKIEIETNIDNYRDALLLSIQSGNIPDLLTMPAGIETQVVNNGWVLPLEEVPGVEELLGRFSSYLVKERHIYNGKTYALPLEVLPIKMAYNKDLFRKAGIVDANGEPTPPKTWDEVTDYAKRITDAGKGREFGFGHTWAFVVGYRRMLIKAFIPSVGHFWFDHQTGRYDFSAFKPALEFMMKTKKDRSFFPGPESIQIDPIRAQFSEGRIGMMISPSYDIGVFNDQFPAVMDWDICEMPVVDPNNSYKSPMLDRTNVSIGANVTADRMNAVVEAFKWMHSKELYTVLYENNAIIPHEQDIINNAKNVQEKTGWRNMSDLTYGYSILPWPDSLLTLEGSGHKDVFDQVWMGKISIDEALADLDRRYNEALDSAIKEGKIDIEAYKVDVDLRVR